MVKAKLDASSKTKKLTEVASAIGLACLASNFFLCLVSSGQVSD